MKRPAAATDWYTELEAEAAAARASAAAAAPEPVAAAGPAATEQLSSRLKPKVPKKPCISKKGQPVIF